MTQKCFLQNQTFPGGRVPLASSSDPPFSLRLPYQSGTAGGGGGAPRAAYSLPSHAPRFALSATNEVIFLSVVFFGLGCIPNIQEELCLKRKSVMKQ